MHTATVLVPAISRDPVTCVVHGEVCVIEGDLVVGRVEGGVVHVSGLLAQRPAAASEHEHVRRLSFVKGYNAYLWKGGVVSDDLEKRFAYGRLPLQIMAQDDLRCVCIMYSTHPGAIRHP